MSVSAQILPKPMIFSALMVRALLAGRKTQTRRVMQPQPEVEPYSNTDMGEDWGSWVWPARGSEAEDGWTFDDAIFHQPYGEELWVRERLERSVSIPLLNDLGNQREAYGIKYAATQTPVPYKLGAREGYCGRAIWEWKNKTLPSIHMPRWACRLRLKITDVTIEELQRISPEDAIAEGLATWDSPEGVTHYGFDAPDVWEPNPVTTYARLWDSLNGKRYPWKSNPWVWVLTFEVSHD